MSETVKFVKMMDHFFDCLNVTNLVTGKQKRKPFQDPYRSEEDFRLKVDLHTLFAPMCLYNVCISGIMQ